MAIYLFKGWCAKLCTRSITQANTAHRRHLDPVMIAASENLTLVTERQRAVRDGGVQAGSGQISDQSAVQQHGHSSLQLFMQTPQG